jgi:hypothetical protein
MVKLAAPGASPQLINTRYVTVIESCVASGAKLISPPRYFSGELVCDTPTDVTNSKTPSNRAKFRNRFLTIDLTKNSNLSGKPSGFALQNHFTQEFGFWFGLNQKNFNPETD